MHTSNLVTPSLHFPSPTTSGVFDEKMPIDCLDKNSRIPFCSVSV